MKTENEVKAEIKQWLDFNGWFHFHVMQGKWSYKGVSDIIAMKNRIVLFIECKRPDGKQSDEQIEFQKDVERKKCHYILARSFQDVSDYIRDNLGGVI